jgi:hypothetical protein
MTRAPDLHLSSDDIDAWLAGELPAPLALHLERCERCYERAIGEREIIAQLTGLPQFSPSHDFADQVMARVRLGQSTVQVPAVARPAAAAPAAAATAPVPVAARRRLVARRHSLAVAAGVALAVVGAMAGSVAWSLANQATLASLGSWLAAEGSHWLWLGLRAVASNVLEQPWYGAVRTWMATPGRIALTVGLALAAYLTGLLTLRRLMTAPTPRVADAAW